MTQDYKELEKILYTYRFDSQAIDEDLVLQQDAVRVYKAHQSNLDDAITAIQAYTDQQVRKMLEELKQCKNVAGEPLVNLGTEVWIDDRIAQLTKEPTYSQLKAEKTEALRPIAKEIVEGLSKGEQE